VSHTAIRPLSLSDVVVVKQFCVCALQLDVIRRCGHSHEFFFLELGRSSMTGPGELWLQVEDTVIAQNMHEAILK